LELNVFWFVGLILVYYALYPFLANYARRPLMLGMVAIALMTPFAVVTYATGSIDIRFFIYFPMFISGILVSCFREYMAFFNSKIGSIGLSICFISSALVLPLFEYGSNIGLPSPIRFAIFVALMAMITLSAGSILYLVGNRLEKDSVVTRSIVNMSQCSYAIYLVHVTILILISQVLGAIGVDGALFYLMMIVTALSCVVIGYSINLASSLLSNAVTRRRLVRTMIVNRELPFEGHRES
jgi:peptidoglycan/LPS O-acetylase OafA/YrhL